MTSAPVFKYVSADLITVECTTGPIAKQNRGFIGIFRVVELVGDYAPLGDILIDESEIPQGQRMILSTIPRAPKALYMVHIDKKVSAPMSNIRLSRGVEVMQDSTVKVMHSIEPAVITNSYGTYAPFGAVFGIELYTVRNLTGHTISRLINTDYFSSTPSIFAGAVVKIYTRGVHTAHGSIGLVDSDTRYLMFQSSKNLPQLDAKFLIDTEENTPPPPVIEVKPTIPIFKAAPADLINVMSVSGLIRGYQDDHFGIFRIMNRVGNYAPLGDIIIKGADITIGQIYKMSEIPNAPSFLYMVLADKRVSANMSDYATENRYNLYTDSDISKTLFRYTPASVSLNGDVYEQHGIIFSINKTLGHLGNNLYRLINQKYFTSRFNELNNIAVQTITSGTRGISGIGAVDAKITAYLLSSSKYTLDLKAVIEEPLNIDAVYKTPELLAPPEPPKATIVEMEEVEEIIQVSPPLTVKPDYVEADPMYDLEDSIHIEDTTHIPVFESAPVFIDPSTATATTATPAAPAATATTAATAATPISVKPPVLATPVLATPEGFFSKYMIWIIVIVAVLAGVVVYNQSQKNNNNYEVESIDTEYTED